MIFILGGEVVTKLFLLQFYLFGCGFVRLRKKLFTIATAMAQTFLLGLARLARKYKISLRNNFVTTSIVAGTKKPLQEATRLIQKYVGSPASFLLLFFISSYHKIISNFTHIKSIVNTLDFALYKIIQKVITITRKATK